MSGADSELIGPQRQTRVSTLSSSLHRHEAHAHYSRSSVAAVPPWRHQAALTRSKDAHHFATFVLCPPARTPCMSAALACTARASPVHEPILAVSQTLCLRKERLPEHAVAIQEDDALSLLLKPPLGSCYPLLHAMSGAEIA